MNWTCYAVFWKQAGRTNPSAWSKIPLTTFAPKWKLRTGLQKWPQCEGESAAKPSSNTVASAALWYCGGQSLWGSRKMIWKPSEAFGQIVQALAYDLYDLMNSNSDGHGLWLWGLSVVWNARRRCGLWCSTRSERESVNWRDRSTPDCRGLSLVICVPCISHRFWCSFLLFKVWANH